VAVAVALTLTFVALGAGFAWSQVFVDNWPTSDMRAVEAVAALVGIAIQPLIALVVCYATKR
jgi:hypothetical protein